MVRSARGSRIEYAPFWDERVTLGYDERFGSLAEPPAVSATALPKRQGGHGNGRLDTGRRLRRDERLCHNLAIASNIDPTGPYMYVTFEDDRSWWLQAGRVALPSITSWR